MRSALNRDNFVERTRPHWARLHRFAARLCGNADRAADLVQEALLRAFRARERYDGRQPIAPWLLTIVRNACWDELRAAGRRPESPLQDDDLTADADPDALSRVLVTEKVLRLEEHLAALPAEFREVLLLVVLEGLTYDEAAVVIGAPVGTVRSRLFRGRAQLAARLAGDRELFGAGDRIEGEREDDA